MSHQNQINRPPVPTICRNCGSNSRCAYCGADPNAPPRELTCTLGLKCFCFFFLVLVILIVIWISIAFSISNYSDPASPVIAVTALSLSNYTLDVRLSIYNPNDKATIYYDDVVFSLYSHGRYLGGVYLAPFNQVGRNLAFVDLGFSELDVGLVDGAGSSGRVLNLGLTGAGSVVFRGHNKRGRDGKVMVQCDNVGVVVAHDGSPGTMFGNGTGGELLCWVKCDNCHLVPLYLDGFMYEIA